jgi:hypothetical protein
VRCSAARLLLPHVQPGSSTHRRGCVRTPAACPAAAAHRQSLLSSGAARAAQRHAAALQRVRLRRACGSCHRAC